MKILKIILFLLILSLNRQSAFAAEDNTDASLLPQNTDAPSEIVAGGSLLHEIHGGLIAQLEADKSSVLQKMPPELSLYGSSSGGFYWHLSVFSDAPGDVPHCRQDALFACAETLLRNAGRDYRIENLATTVLKAFMLEVIPRLFDTGGISEKDRSQLEKLRNYYYEAAYAVLFLGRNRMKYNSIQKEDAVAQEECVNDLLCITSKKGALGFLEDDYPVGAFSMGKYILEKEVERRASMGWGYAIKALEIKKFCERYASDRRLKEVMKRVEEGTAPAWMRDYFLNKMHTV
ncbi:hypothetical protein OAN22_00560 [Alphaproteobacteria bacterium]|nr:hypothetical protein [Alphaproteobacteria bacterium]